MTIINKFPENLDVKTQYKLMKSPEVQRMKDADGSVLELKSWLIYTDTSSTGEDIEVLSVETETGELFSTISQAFIREFKDIVEVFGGDFGELKVLSRKSKAGRTYLVCTIV